ncbi:MAG: hypothetical protein OEU92_21420 [Alphaproteobacteria bacterium]|nr:hypothetical protein [Alphaproteobacteria bacterium]
MSGRYLRVFSCAAAILFSAPALASEALTIIVPNGAGGALDKFARTAAQFLPGRHVTIENATGKDEAHGYLEFKRRSADTTTAIAWFEPAGAAFEHTTGMSLDDLTIINVQEIESPIIIARRDLGWSSLQDAIAAIRNEPYRYIFGSGRHGGGGLLASSLFAKLELPVRISMESSGGAARKKLLAGEIDLVAGSARSAKKLGEKAVPLAIFSPRRVRAWAQTPTLREALGAEGDNAVFGGVYRYFAVDSAFASSHPDAFKDLVEAFRQMTEDDPSFQRHADQQGIGRHWFGPVESQSLVARARAHYKQILIQMEDAATN